MSTIEKVIFWVVVVAAFALMVFHSGRVEYRRGYNDAIASIKPDTVYRDTTIYEDRPVPTIEYRDTGRIVYVKVPATDSTGKADTIIVPMNPEVKRYADTVNHSYELQISGISPNLDWIKVNQRTAYITVPVPEYKYPKFMLSPSVEAQIIPNAFFASANLELDFWKGRWQMGIKGGYGGGFVAGQPVHGAVATVNAKYNLIRK